MGDQRGVGVIVGRRNGWMFLTTQVDDLMGLTTKQYQSGSINRNGRIARYGNTLGRTLLYEAAVMMGRASAPYGPLS